jgi:HEAT repeat protein
MAALTYLCPGCGAEVGTGAVACPRCDRCLAEFDALPFEAKLIVALGNPIRETRMLAIQILGARHSRAALPAFASIVNQEADPYVLAEVARALARIGGPESQELLLRLESHASALVRGFAQAVRHDAAPGGAWLGPGQV